MRRFLNNLKGDKAIWAVVFMLSLISILAVYSSTGTLAYRSRAGNTEYYLLKHLSILIMGLALMYFSHMVKYTYYSRISQIALFLAIPLLFITLITGTNINDANRWLTLPVININFQTSDFAKLALIIYVARMLSKKQDQIKDFKTAFLPIMAPILITCMLIFPANLSTAVILFATSAILMFIGRVNLRYIFSLLGIMILASGVFVLILMNSPDKGRLGTWKNRITAFAGNDSRANQDEKLSDYTIENCSSNRRHPGQKPRTQHTTEFFAAGIFRFYLCYHYRRIRAGWRTCCPDVISYPFI
jgi:cell division protein FtsW